MESQHQKWVTLSYLAAAMLLGFVVYTMAGKIIGFYDLEARIRNVDFFLRVISVVAGAVLFIALYRHEQTNQFMHEVVVELSRVSWPTVKETGSATVVVIIMVVISGLVLGFLDYCWIHLLKWIL